MSNAVSPQEALQKAVKIAGSQSAFARICGVRQPAVWKWLNVGKPLPPHHALVVEAKTGVSRHLLCPDIYPISLPAGVTTTEQRSSSPISAIPTTVVCDRSAKAQRKGVA